MKVSAVLCGFGILSGLLLSAAVARAEEPVVAAATNQVEAEMAGTMVLIKTSMGDMKVELFDAKAPETVKNFLAYADAKHYDGTIFHRVIPNFMIQGGGFTPDMQQKATKAPIQNEAKAELKNTRGTLAMARTAALHSATSQFFVNVVDNAFLDHTGESAQAFGYCVFGRVVEGMDVADKIVAVKRGSVGPYQDVPTEPVVITSVTRVEQK